jgi:sulfide:quinone oxidoreductase
MPGSTDEFNADARIVIAGGGVAAIEAVLALRALGGDTPNITLISATPTFKVQALSTLKPFARGHSDELSLPEFLSAQGGSFIEGRVAAIDAERRVLILDHGDEVGYDELLVAVGGQPVKGTDQGNGFEPASPETVSGITSDLELGWAESVAVIVPDGPSWPLPGYEFALQLAQQMGGATAAQGHVHLFIPTDEPVPFFGPRVSGEVRALLAESGVLLHSGVPARVVRTGIVERDGGLPPIKVDRILAIPRVVGPAIPGLPQNDEAFIPVDDHARVVGIAHVHAAGDGTSLPYKFGALACQQADAAAADILATLGYDIAALPLDPVYDARLVSGDRELILHHDPSGAARPPARWVGGSKIAGRYLTPFLEEQGIGHVAHREAAT